MLEWGCRCAVRWWGVFVFGEVMLRHGKVLGITCVMLGGMGSGVCGMLIQYL
jgi:hypothetical protein